MTRETHPPAAGPAARGAKLRTNDARDINAVSIGECPTADAAGTTRIPCPRCACRGPHQYGPGAGPHAVHLVCGSCGRWLRWLPKRREGTR
jgi:hypothetical protein